MYLKVFGEIERHGGYVIIIQIVLGISEGSAKLLGMKRSMLNLRII